MSAIEAQGELVRQQEWGERALAYPIDRKANADYHLLQFHAGQAALLEGLDRTLRITDGVLRHRIIKLRPGTPEPTAAAAAPPRPTEATDAGAPEGAVPEVAAPEEPTAQEPIAQEPIAEEPVAAEAAPPVAEAAPAAEPAVEAADETAGDAS